MQTPLSAEQINQLQSFNTCVISDAIETFGVRLRNEGFATAGFRCLFKSFPPLVGYAATCKIRSAHPPIVGSRYVERTDWWKHIIVEFGGLVEVGGLKIRPGDLLHGDRHGIINVPHDLAAQLPAVASRIMAKKQQVVELSKKSGASLEELGQTLRELLDFNMDHRRDGVNQWEQR